MVIAKSLEINDVEGGMAGSIKAVEVNNIQYDKIGM